MRQLSLTALSLALLLTACGGGDPSPSTAPAEVKAFVAQAAGPQRRAAAAPSTSSEFSATQLFDWAEFKYGPLFPKTGAQNFELDHEGLHFEVRAYANGNFLGLASNGQVYGLGPFTGGQLQSFGVASAFAAQVQADRCSVYPSQCGNNGPLGSLNECTAPAAQTLVSGRRLLANYVVSGTGEGAGNGEYTLDLRVEGSSSFEGQSAIKVRSLVNGTFTAEGQTSTNKMTGVSYEQVADGGLIRSLGDESEHEIQMGGTLMKQSMRVVMTPPELNSEFTLRPGQSITKTSTSRVTSSTSMGGVSQPATTNTVTSTSVYTYEARETVTVQGRSYDTCRYKEVDPSMPNLVTKNWVLVGHGIPVRTLNTTPDSTQTLEAKSIELNGSRL
ncbi:hypothetical protein [Zoogloea sp.]|uniref:hypothetical protein n=1 Tax=Zoogloea sp. TaxID=49181 RepID=UPI00321FA1DF